MQYLIVAYAFNISKPFKRSITTNYYLCAFLLLSMLFGLLLIFTEDPLILDIFSVN